MSLFYAFGRGALGPRLLRHAESDYTAYMRARLTFLSILFVFGLTLPHVSAAADGSPRDTLAALNALQLDSQNVYKLAPKDRIELREADVVLTLEEGKVAFFQPFEGKITGFVFSGVGHIVALPRDSAEKQQMARFLGSPVLDQQFVSAYARFTDDTSKDLLEQFKNAELTPAADPDFVALWRTQLQRQNPSHSLRILFERYSAHPRHFFHAGMDGLTTGPFDVLLDDMRDENLVLGQPRSVEKVDYYDIWASYATQGFAIPKVPYDAVHYRIDTFIHPDNSLEGETSVDFRGLTGGEQLLLVQLARSLKVDSVTLNDTALPFFQNEGITQRELRTQGSDTLCIFLPTAPKPGEDFTVRFKYRGNIIEDAGNGVLYVGAREMWYPRYGDPAEFALYDMTLRWPKRLRLVATGNKLDEREDGDFHTGHWNTSQPVPEAGFNLGEYAVASLSSENHNIDVYANHQLEEAILARLTHPTGVDPSIAMHLPDRPAVHAMAPSLAPPSPADALRQVAKEIDASIHFYERYSGPFPFAHLGVSQIPGAFGQGWPGLLYLSTFSFMPQTAQQKVGLTEPNQELFTEIVPAHEVAHQWWGNVVGWSSYHDQWINESIAAYLALLFADSQKNTDRTVRIWLERHRAVLLEKSINDNLTAADVGPLIMGSRLSSSKSPDAYDKVIYSKGIWIIHMLHEMLRQPGTQNPDARFVALLHTLVTKYAQKALTTAELQREVEAVITPKMDLEGGRSMAWFFEQYVRGNGLPRYKVEFTTKRTDKGFQVKGTLFQSGVPRSFIAPVPLYANIGQGRSVLLGTVVSGGPETSFNFNLSAASAPHKILIDPHITLLCVSE